MTETEFIWKNKENIPSAARRREGMFSFGVWGQLENNIIRGTKHTNGTDKLSGRQSVREVCFFQAASALCPYHITLYRNCHRNKTRKSPHFKGNITFFQKIFIHSERIFTIFFTAVTRVPHAFFSAKSRLSRQLCRRSSAALHCSMMVKL